ncbi:MAG: hypothetical protein QM757_34145 [Paludibaculum sp.]
MFKEMDGWKPRSPATRKLRGKWWELFNGPGLDELEGSRGEPRR